jgi:hypothetical protein
LPSVPGGTRQWLNLCRVLLGRHSAKLTPLPSVILDTRQRSCLRHPIAVTAAFLCRVLPGTQQTSLPSAPWHSANLFAECPRKSTRQRRLCRCTVCRAFFAECHTRQSLCRVLRALSKAPVSGSVGLFVFASSARMLHASLGFVEVALCLLHYFYSSLYRP